MPRLCGIYFSVRIFSERFRRYAGDELRSLQVDDDELSAFGTGTIAK
jgi:hypothetical protein